jgi:hypothetical protein
VRVRYCKRDGWAKMYLRPRSESPVTFVWLRVS